MRVKVSTRLETAPRKVLEKLQEPAVLAEIASPLIVVKPVSPDHLTESWDVDREYTFRLYFFKVLPLGTHTIRVVDIDRVNNRMLSNESGKLIRVWNHLITLEEDGDGNTIYTDDVEVKAGLKTPFIWLFAHLFYRHRQRKWRRIARGL